MGRGETISSTTLLGKRNGGAFDFQQDWNDVLGPSQSQGGEGGGRMMMMASSASYKGFHKVPRLHKEEDADEEPFFTAPSAEAMAVHYPMRPSSTPSSGTFSSPPSSSCASMMMTNSTPPPTIAGTLRRSTIAWACYGGGTSLSNTNSPAARLLGGRRGKIGLGSKQVEPRPLPDTCVCAITPTMAASRRALSSSSAAPPHHTIITRGAHSPAFSVPRGRCGHCDKGYCMTCERNCEVCEGSFCTICSTLDYSGPFQRVVCIECSLRLTSHQDRGGGMHHHHSSPSHHNMDMEL